MAEPLIKPDPDAVGPSPVGFADDIIDEDYGDLEFNTDPKYEKLYLARVPKYIWETWSKMDDDAEIQIGTIRQSSEIGPDGRERHKLQMLLKSDLAQHQLVPKEYDLQITSEAVSNTFVFTEQDLPGYKSKSSDRLESDMPAWLNKDRNAKDKGTEKQPWDKSKRFQPYYRRAIPKKTTLLGKVAHEVNCVAVLNAEAERILAERTREGMKPKAGTIWLGDHNSIDQQGFIQPGTVRATGAFSGFIKNTGTNKPKSQETKTARMPQNELLDRILGCFRRYNYWSMKNLRQELQQPEAYLRETLEKIADMPRSGRFAMLWTLKPDYKQDNYLGTEEGVAPTNDLGGGANGDGAGDDEDEGDADGEGDEGDDGEDDDDEVKMEDVLPT